VKPRERVVAALNCRTPDRVPVVEYLFSPKLQQTLLGCTTPLYDGPSQLALAQKLGLDGMWIPINGFCGLEEEVHPMGASYQDGAGRRVRVKSTAAHAGGLLTRLRAAVELLQCLRDLRMPNCFAIHASKDNNESYDNHIAILLLSNMEPACWLANDCLKRDGGGIDH
jgi:hypothetical protein